MSKKFVLKFNGFDVIVGIVSCFIACVLLLVNNFAFSNKVKLDDKVAFIYYNSNKLEDYTIYFKELKDDEIKEIVLLKKDYPLLNADMTILVSKSEVIKVEEEESPQKICSKQGWVKRVDVPVVCLPNSVYVIIMDINDIDINIGLE
jgi:hypothetical protein